jgi:hypothetical protein
MFSTCIFLWENGITTKPNYTLGEGWATISITHPDGCVVIDSVFIPYSSPVVGGSQITDVSCNGFNDGSIQVSPGGASGFTCSWSTGNATPIVTSLAAGTYTLYASDSRPCYDTLQFTVNQPDSITATFTTNHETCFDANNGSIQILAAGGVGAYTYQSNGLTVTNPMDSLGAGTYPISIIDSNNCISQIYVETITAPAPLSLTIVSTPESALNSLDGTATANVFGGTPPYSYQWDDPNQQTNNTATYLTQGWYIVSAIDSNSCYISDSVFIGVTGISDLESSRLIAFPNPTNGILKFNSPIENWTLLDANGKALQHGVIDAEIDLNSYSSGSYTLQINGAEGPINFKVLKISN